MSLFHSIMYPVTDVTDPNQVDHIPREITEPWISEILAIMQFEPKVGFDEIDSLAQFAHAALLWKASDTWKSGDAPNNVSTHFHVWENHFLLRLQAHILRYDE